MPLTKALAPFVPLALALVLLAGCGGDRQSDAPAAENAAPDGERPRVALIMKSLANEFFVSMADGAEAHHAAHDDEYDLVVNGIRNESDIAQQVALVEQMIGTGVEAIVIAPADSRSLIPVLRRAQEAGIVVVNIDNKLDAATLQQAGATIPFVGPDNRAGARAVGDALAARLQRGDAVAILEGVPTAFNAQQRRLGFEEAMQAAGMRVVGVQSGQWEQAAGNTAAAGFINAHPDLKAILASNDNMALGAAAAIRQAGKEGQILLVGFDNIEAVREMVRDGRVLATADQHGDQLAVFGIEYALGLLGGGQTPQDRQTPVDLVTAETLGQAAP
jgi:ribose transport system substrate-binding protein